MLSCSVGLIPTEAALARVTNNQKVARFSTFFLVTLLFELPVEGCLLKGPLWLCDSTSTMPIITSGYCCSVFLAISSFSTHPSMLWSSYQLCLGNLLLYLSFKYLSMLTLPKSFYQAHVTSELQIVSWITHQKISFDMCNNEFIVFLSKSVDLPVLRS